ncbi:MAG: hypothetical protein JJU45_09465 [Acidimicrobiia bacterium]|nr:hypothetical protein [Acidimicrobiia bacterium]
MGDGGQGDEPGENVAGDGSSGPPAAVDAAARDRRIRLPVGLATAIGSVPHHDPSEAVDFVLRNCPRLPAAPSLPGRSRREGMIAQAAWGVRGITVDAGGSLIIDDAALDPEAPLEDPGFSSDAFVGLRAFLSAVADRRGPVKVSLTGPVTFGIALHAAGVDPSVAFRLASAAVNERAVHLVDYVRSWVPQSQVVAFIDEPALGAAMFREFPVDPETAVDLASGALAALEPGAITGLHCCALDADWRLLMQAGPQVLSLPTDAALQPAAGALANYLERGGWVAWGAVPTDRPIGTTVERMWRALQVLWCDLVADGGCDPVLLRTQAMITPACGLVNHGVTQAEQVLWFTNRLAERLHDQAVSTRLIAGA